jgi:O-acetyl-ADP-ribose deacetylase (regulator of RNase III)
MASKFKVWQQWLEPTREEVERAIYIDFEGFTEKAPSFVGEQVEGFFRQVVFDESLKPAAEAKGLDVISFQAYIDDLVQRAQTEARLIVAYSEHEQNVIREFAGADISARYLDARKLAKLWKTRCHCDTKIGMGLKDFLVFINYERPSCLGEQKSTKRLHSVVSMLASRGSYDTLTTTVKAQWTKVLQHNRIDVQGMRALVFQAAEDLSGWHRQGYILKKRIRVIEGDITTLDVDAIVNAANCSLMGGGGVDGAIHRAAGPELPLACLKLKGCDVGEAKLTQGFKLPARYVIHTVGPTYWGDNLKKDGRGVTLARRLLRRTYTNCMALAAKNRFRTLAFPSISTGAFRYPMREATEVAVGSVVAMLKSQTFPRHVILVAYSHDDFLTIKEVISERVSRTEESLRNQGGDPWGLGDDPFEEERGPIIRFTGRMAEAELLAEGHPGGLGFCHAIWKRQKMMLWNQFNWDWRTPAERNPWVRFD